MGKTAEEKESAKLLALRVPEDKVGAEEPVRMNVLTRNNDQKKC